MASSTAAVLKTACRACLRAEGRLAAAHVGGASALDVAWGRSARAELRGAVRSGRTTLAVDMALRYLQLVRVRG
jgi:hypothetical protein